MTKEYAKKFWRRYLHMAIRGKRGMRIADPAETFRSNLKAGDYDSMSDEEYGELIKNNACVRNIWNCTENTTVGDMLLTALSKTKMNMVTITELAGLLAENTEIRADDSPDEFMAAVEGVTFDPEELLEEIPLPEPAKDPYAGITPKDIYDILDARIRGQEEAKKAASMIVFGTMRGGRSNSVFIGPTGCGKSEIWRCLSKQYPGLIKIVDASRMAPDGWSGSQHVSGVFYGTDPESIKKNGLIIVLDEADKVFCETIKGSNGTDFSAMMQSEFLKMFDGDTVEFEGSYSDRENGRKVDCSRVSFVLLGAFEKVLDRKDIQRCIIGFGSESPDEQPSHRTVTNNDLMDSGMRRELMGRINRTVFLDPLTVEDYETILDTTVITDMKQEYGFDIKIKKKTVRDFARQAYDSGLGVRRMRSLVMDAVDRKVFEAPFLESYAI